MLNLDIFLNEIKHRRNVNVQSEMKNVLELDVMFLTSCGKSRVFVETDAHFLISRAERKIIFHFGADEADLSKNTESIMKHYRQKHKQSHSGQT